MTTLALTAPANAVATAAGTTFAAAETSLATFAGFSVPNNGLVLVRLVVGASGTGTLQFVAQHGSNPAGIVVANSTVYIFGPFDPAIYSDSGGLLQATITVVTGNSVGAYSLPVVSPFAHGLHNPFQNTLTAPDA